MARRNGRRPQHVVRARPHGVRDTGTPGPSDAGDAGLDLVMGGADTHGAGDAGPAQDPRAARPVTARSTLAPDGRRAQDTQRAPGGRAPIDPFGPPVAVLAPRVALASLVTTLVATVLGALAVVVYTDATDPQHPGLGTWVSDLARTAGVGALAGLGVGALVALLTTWVAIAIRRQLGGPLQRSRLLALLGTLVCWALAVTLLLHLVGFGGLGSLGFAVGLPGLVVALVTSWLVTPWALRGARPEENRGA